MAFGKATDCKRVRNMVEEDLLWKIYVRSEDAGGKIWDMKWRWILDEYKDLHEKLDKVSKTSSFIDTHKQKPDNRTIHKIPETTNHEYGWIATRPEFKLDTLGPDLTSIPPLPEMYKIFKG